MRRAAPALALALASCVAVEGFDPVGDQAAVSGEWLIDGLPPNTRVDGLGSSNRLCEALGATRVRVTFLDDRRPVTHSGLFFQCSLGQFDTRLGAGAVVAAGEWTMRLDALDGSGEVVAVGTPITQTVEQGTYDPATGTPLIDLSGEGEDHPADFLSATISARFRLGAQDANGERCAALGVATVGLVFDDLGGGRVRRAEPEACALGLVGTRVLPGHTYTVHLSAYDAGGGVRFETAPRAFTVARGADVRLDDAGPVALGP
ncbi:MAG: hypothetical protein KF729_18445 [Sandaracinaceae bacterium]|nr:hypothetical protein [Sandaracinaceae bacterium]